MLDVAVIILTYNEEKNIGRCLENVTKFSKEVYIIDSFSNDKTIIGYLFLPDWAGYILIVAPVAVHSFYWTKFFIFKYQ